MKQIGFLSKQWRRFEIYCGDFTTWGWKCSDIASSEDPQHPDPHPDLAEMEPHLETVIDPCWRELWDSNPVVFSPGGLCSQSSGASSAKTGDQGHQGPKVTFGKEVSDGKELCCAFEKSLDSCGRRLQARAAKPLQILSRCKSTCYDQAPDGRTGRENLEFRASFSRKMAPWGREALEKFQSQEVCQVWTYTSILFLVLLSLL